MTDMETPMETFAGAVVIRRDDLEVLMGAADLWADYLDDDGEDYTAEAVGTIVAAINAGGDALASSGVDFSGLAW